MPLEFLLSPPSRITVTDLAAGTLLAAGATFSQWVDLSVGGGVVSATSRADVTGTLSLEDGTVNTGTGQALDSVASTLRGTLYTASARIVTTSRYVRVVYVNGATIQTSFRLDWTVVR